MSVDIGRGSRLPAWATSMGRVLLSALPEEQLEVTLSRAVLIRYTPHTLCDMAGLRAEIDRVRMQGYALADRQIEVGLCSLAVPVLSRHGQVVAALNVGVPAATVSAAALKEKALARYAARRWTCRYSYSAVCGFVTVARLRQIPAASSRSMTPAVASTRLCAG